jgi:calmodulin
MFQLFDQNTQTINYIESQSSPRVNVDNRKLSKATSRSSTKSTKTLTKSNAKAANGSAAVSPSSKKTLSNKTIDSIQRQESSENKRSSRSGGPISFARSLSRTLSRSNSKDSRRSQPPPPLATRPQLSQSVTNSPAPYHNFKRVVQIFTSSQMMDLKTAFTMFDKNGDQKISAHELLQVMKYLGLETTEKEVKAMIKVVDKNCNGYVDYDEFIQMMTQTQLKPISADEELRKTFNVFDIDGNGYISADEIKKTMSHLGENLTDEEVNDMIKAADKNGDGKIDLSEFSGLINGSGGLMMGQNIK